MRYARGAWGSERALAEGEPPDIVVFYDGLNDRSVQGQFAPPATVGAQPSDHPTTYETGADVQSVPRPFSVTTDLHENRSLAGQWVDNSFVLDLLDINPADAAVAGTPPSHGFVERVLDVYARGRAIAASMAERHAVEPLFFWQPSLVGEAGRGPEVTARLTAPTIDITDAFAGEDPADVYLDGSHTNERGARLVAEAIWQHLRPAVEASSPG